MTNVCIIAARRTPQGRFLGALKDQSAMDLACAAGDAVLQRIDPRSIDQVIIGNVLSAGQGMNLARQIGIRLGLPVEVPAFTVNMMCASGMKAVMLGTQAIKAGEARVVLCGGTESMSNAPYLLPRARTGYRLGDATVVDSLLSDGLVDPLEREHMGLMAERLAEQYRISRAEQDAFALRSQQLHAQAAADGEFADELVAVDGLAVDEQPRPDSTLEKLASLRPAFKEGGTVTAGNASSINDGAAMLLLSERAVAERQGWPILATIQADASTGCEPKMMGLGPLYATQLLCRRAGAALNDFDTIEINEAFAAQALANLREWKVDPGRINPQGGAIAMGHPIGASGARLVVHLAHRIARQQSHRALATLCVGGGMGAAIALTTTTPNR